MFTHPCPQKTLMPDEQRRLKRVSEIKLQYALSEFKKKRFAQALALLQVHNWLSVALVLFLFRLLPLSFPPQMSAVDARKKSPAIIFFLHVIYCLLLILLNISFGPFHNFSPTSLALLFCSSIPPLYFLLGFSPFLPSIFSSFFCSPPFLLFFSVCGVI